MKALEQVFSEVLAGGFTSIDGTVEFYGRVKALLSTSCRVLDYGAGRGAWFDEDECTFRRQLRQMRGYCREVIGCDIDDAILRNRSVDKAVLCDRSARLPFADGAFEIVIADYVFEHISDPESAAREISRVVAHGGWICARTPGKWSYSSIITRLIRNSFHVDVLRWAQPSRKEHDVFPTEFKLNTKSAICAWFPEHEFENYSYYYQSEPAYHFESVFVLTLMRGIHWLLPLPLCANLFIFLRKR